MIQRVVWSLVFLLGAAGQVLHLKAVSARPRRSAYLYYTNLSNLFVTLFYLAMAVTGGIWPFSHPAVRLAAASCILITNLIYHFLLLPRWRVNPERAFQTRTLDNALVHYVVPFAAVAEWLFLADKQMAWTGAFSAIVLPGCYALFALARVPIIRRKGGAARYPYFFMDPDQIGWKKVARNVLLVGLGCGVLGFIMWGVGATL